MKILKITKANIKTVFTRPLRTGQIFTYSEIFDYKEIHATAKAAGVGVAYLKQTERPAGVGARSVQVYAVSLRPEAIVMP